jgi:E3 ubiquitin-protein ligase RAD18
LALARKDETVEGTNGVREQPVEVEEDPAVILALLPALPPPMAMTRSTTRAQHDKMTCPICFKPFKSPEAIDLHIDSCRGPIFDPSHINQTPISSTRPPPPQPISSNGPREKSGPLPKLNYALLKDKDLRNTLSTLGVPNYGNKALMSSRHKEYVNLYNANLDCKNPVPQPELLRRLDTWERTQVRGDGEGKKREIDGEEWEKRYQVDFTDLTRAARESAKRRKIEESENEGEHVEGVQVAL